MHTPKKDADDEASQEPVGSGGSAGLNQLAQVCSMARYPETGTVKEALKANGSLSTESEREDPFLNAQSLLPERTSFVASPCPSMSTTNPGPLRPAGSRSTAESMLSTPKDQSCGRKRRRASSTASISVTDGDVTPTPTTAGEALITTPSGSSRGADVTGQSTVGASPDERLNAERSLVTESHDPFVNARTERKSSSTSLGTSALVSGPLNSTGAGALTLEDMLTAPDDRPLNAQEHGVLLALLRRSVQSGSTFAMVGGMKLSVSFLPD